VSIGSVQRMVFPVSALLLLVIGRGALRYLDGAGRRGNLVVGLWPEIHSLLDGYALSLDTQRISALVVLQAVFLAGTEALIPNETIITSTAVNHSYTTTACACRCQCR